jgi:hypothetical protein
MKNYNLIMLTFLLISFLITGFLLPLSANPIPVFPNPEPTYQSPVTFISTQQGFAFWILIILILDFIANLLIIYFCFFLLIHFNLESSFLFKNISRLQFLYTAGFISIIGIFLETVLGTWIFGLFLILFFVFLSYYFFCSYFFNISKKNAFLFAIIAVVLNLCTWSIFFAIF